MPQLIDHPSPNHGPRRSGPVDMLVLHYTGMRDGAAALARLCDPAAEVSAHYLVGEDGTIFRLVAEDRRAWHAGASYWAGERDINSRSIGIELVNPGHEWGYRPFPAAQMAALTELAADIIARHAIPPARVLGHSDVAPGRKQDPGELFDWAGLAAAGIGLWPAPSAEDRGDASPAGIVRLLRRIGYEVGAVDCRAGISWDAEKWHGISWENSTHAALAAFQRHWAPKSLEKGADAASVAALRALVRAIGAHPVAIEAGEA